MLRRPLDDEAKQAIRAAYLAGAGIRQVAREQHRKTDTVRAVLEEGGVTIRPPGWEPGRAWTQNRKLAARRRRNLPRA